MVSDYKNCDSSHVGNMGNSILFTHFKDFIDNNFYKLCIHNIRRYMVASTHDQNYLSILNNSLDF